MKCNTTILVLGATGTFGSIIVEQLYCLGYRVIAGARDLNKLQKKFLSIKQDDRLLFAVIDLEQAGLGPLLEQYAVNIVINTCGPFQSQDYVVAKECIHKQAHYIDLADAAEFVKNIVSLDADAKAQNVCVISGASTVPALSSAVISAYIKKFDQLESVNYGVLPGAKTPRGLATTRSILSYLGKPLVNNLRYGWQSWHAVKYPTLGKRWMGACDVPDHLLFPEYYQVPIVNFSAGMESKLLHASIWLISWFSRWGWVQDLSTYAGPLLRLSHQFDRFGSQDGGMHVFMRGKAAGKSLCIRWFIEAYRGLGPLIPCAAAILLVEQIIQEQKLLPGARPCMDLITLARFTEYFSQFGIKTFERSNS